MILSLLGILQIKKALGFGGFCFGVGRGLYRIGKPVFLRLGINPDFLDIVGELFALRTDCPAVFKVLLDIIEDVERNWVLECYGWAVMCSAIVVELAFYSYFSREHVHIDECLSVRPCLSCDDFASVVFYSFTHM